ncbi:MAG: patatin-like phospholipase family protein [Pleomorphochaeta sp.]
MKKKLKAIILVLFFSLASLNATYPKVALVLSGGGAKGFAQIAVVEEIRKLGIPIDFISGTSMGGLIGGYYALGYTSSDIKEMINQEPLMDYLLYNENNTSSFPPSLFKDPDGIKLSIGLNSKGIGTTPGLLNSQGILSYLNKTTIKSPGEVDFDDLYIPFRAISIDVSSGNEKVLDSGYISDAMRATMSLPIIFPPYLLKDGTYCMDGGLVNNLPTQEAKDWGADIIISVDVSSEDLKNSEDFSTLSGIVIQTINLTTFGNRAESQEISDVLIKPDVSSYMVLEVAKFDEILEKGYEAFEEHKEELIKIRNEIAKYRKLEFESDDTESYYKQIKDPLITEIKFVDISNNNQNYAYTNRFDKYIGLRLTQNLLDQLDEDIQSFTILNNISSVSYNFNPTDSKNNSGVLEIGLRSWQTSSSKIDLLGLAKLGFSSNDLNMAWFYLSFDIHTQLKDMLADKMAVDLKLNISENTKVNAKVGYQFYTESDKELTLFTQFGGSFGSLSPANNKYVKYYLPSFSIGFDVGVGLDYRMSNKFSTEFLANYNLIYLARPTFLCNTISQVSFETPILNIVNLDLSFAYLNMEDSFFATKGYAVDGINSIKFTNGSFNIFSFTEATYNLELSEVDSLKLSGSIGFSTANYQLTSSYFDLGGYNMVPGSYFGFYTREYFLLNLSYQKYILEYFEPLYFQVGAKFYGYDDYNPIENIVLTSDSDMFTGPDSIYPSITDIGLGFYGGVGFKTNWGDIIFGGGFSINGNFNIVLEFV